jgi:chromosomal replication initiation ATPase DnaA
MITTTIQTESFKILDKYFSGSVRIITKNHQWTKVELGVENQAHILQILAAGKQLGRMESEGVITNMSPEFAIEAVCWAFGVTLEQLTGKRRDRGIVDARHAWRYILFKKWNHTKTMVGYLTDSDHTTIINSIAMVENLQQTDENFAQKLKNAVNYINIKTKQNEQLHNSEQSTDLFRSKVLPA